MKKFDIFYFSSTHWDREWYLDFQGFRYRLAKLIDNLIDLFDKDPDYQTFHFDGQTVVLEDYSEITPEKKERLAELIRERRILIGPWYVMPDEFLVSGESLIRNLMQGHKICKEWGTEAWKYGYICDIFGHIAQMPQIFNGFGIKYSTLGRGLTEGDPAFFRWQAPDGSECINFTLEPEHGYGSFNYIYRFEEDKSIDNPNVVNNIKNYIEMELERSEQPIVLLMDGLDHSEAAIHTTDYIKKIAELYPEATIHHVNLCEQGKMVEAHRDELPVIKGELNKTTQEKHGYFNLITNTLSSWYPLKKANDECQNMLEKEIEPLLALARAQGVELNHNFVDVAYKHLLKNHPHDSICGCSIDKVHEDMKYRFSQAKGICKVLRGDYYNQCTRKSDKDIGEKYESILTLHNALPFPIDKTVTVDLEFKPDYPAQYCEPFDYEAINSFKIYDADGNEIAYKVVDIKRNKKRQVYIEPHELIKDIHTVTFRAQIPACGKAEYKIVPVYHAVRYLKTMTSGMDYAENDFIRLDILHNGSLKLTDKKTGKIYENIGNLVDDGEIGDGWYHANPVNDRMVTSVGGAAVIEKVECGPSRCVFKVTRYLEVPEEMQFDSFGKRRSEKTVQLQIVSFVGISAESRYVDVKLSYKNIAKDHRMRMMIPTGITTDRYFSGQAFYCCDRKVGINYDTQDWIESDPYEKATNGVFGKRDENGCGLAFISPVGLHECAAFDDNDGTLGVTLSRSFRKTVFTDGEPGCQINEPLSYSFAIAAIDEDVQYSDLLKIQDMMSTDVFAVLSNVQEGTLPEKPTSNFEVGGKGIATSIIKCPQSGEKDAVIFRVFNASGETSEGFIHSLKQITKAEYTDLNEEYISDAEYSNNDVRFTLEPWKIATFKLYLKA